MKLGVIGTGFIGLVAGTCFAEYGNDVMCMDSNTDLIEALKSGKCNFYEPFLEELLKKNIKEDRLVFSSVPKEVVQHSEIIFLCLPAIYEGDGSSDVSNILEISKEILKLLNDNKIVVLKSTVPAGACEKIRNSLKGNPEFKISFAYNPEFMKKGNAVNDFMFPDRVIIGSSSSKAIDALKELYADFVSTPNKIIVMDERSAEITKFATNAMLASRISLMNEISQLCEKTGANPELVRTGIGTDKRIGERYLFAGTGYGGNSFSRDLKALIKAGEENQIEFKLLKAVEEINDKQKLVLLQKIKRHFGENFSGRKFAVWGLSFKPKTDDIRESPSIEIIQKILENGGSVNLFDPAAIEKAKFLFKKRTGKVKFFESYYDSLKDADAMIIMNEWNEFRKPDFDKMKTLMKTPVIFDGRNIYNPRILKEKKFVYYGIGR